MVAFIHDDFTPVQSVVILRLLIACKWMKGTSIESHVYPTLAYGNLSLLTTSMWEPIKMNSYLNVMLTESLYVSDVNG